MEFICYMYVCMYIFQDRPEQWLEKFVKVTSSHEEKPCTQEEAGGGGEYPTVKSKSNTYQQYAINRKNGKS